ncbi:hypothetical protein [Corynebacterium sp. CNJ-954]|uniref:hypothetical protein n=1 Tax=Corynebacterium sp. CNJ-954 TaxID=1904962 RepID=UPI001115473A|nr:hypothetical protein [Corynebacterium sp. CNJ-954]
MYDIDSSFLLMSLLNVSGNRCVPAIFMPQELTPESLLKDLSDFEELPSFSEGRKLPTSSSYAISVMEDGRMHISQILQKVGNKSAFAPLHQNEFDFWGDHSDWCAMADEEGKVLFISHKDMFFAECIARGDGVSKKGMLDFMDNVRISALPLIHHAGWLTRGDV